MSVECSRNGTWRACANGGVVVMALSLAVAMSCASGPVKQAERHITNGRYDEAIALLEPVLAEMPEDFGVHATLGEAYYYKVLQCIGRNQRDDPNCGLFESRDKAEQHLEKALRIQSMPWVGERLRQVKRAPAFDIPTNAVIEKMKEKGFI